MMMITMMTLTKMVACHSHEESSSSMVCTNGKKKCQIGKDSTLGCQTLEIIANDKYISTWKFQLEVLVYSM